MKFIKDILTKGVFATMIDDRLDKNARRIAWILVTFLYLCVIFGCTLIFLEFEPGGGKITIGILDAIFIILLISLYIRLFIHLHKVKKIKIARKIMLNHMDSEKKSKEMSEEENKQGEVQTKFRT